MIDVKEIKKTCPKSYELLREWVERQISKITTLLNQGEIAAFEDIALPKVDDEMIEGLIMWNERQLFDFFDGKEIHIGIGWTDPWNWCINPEESFQGTSRMDCENEAFKAAFNHLEKQL